MIVVLHILVQAALIVRALLRPNRDPTSRAAWIVVILAVPVIGILAYLLLGETRIGRRRRERVAKVEAGLPDLSRVAGFDAPAAAADIPEPYRALFEAGRSINGMPPVGGNAAELMADSNAAVDRMVADIDAARQHVHALFYIWLDDRNGTRVAEALIRAAGRGVTCRAMVDDLGSRKIVRSALWKRMGADGVRLGRALSVGNPLLRVMVGRIDIRNHRKIVVIDDAVTYCGSQNCADPEFRVKAKFAPWVDALMRFSGPIVRENQHLFCHDWMATCGEDLRPLLTAPLPAPKPGFTAQVIASGPTIRHSAAPEMFDGLIYAARHRLTVTTPYYVPPDSTQSALCAAARRGVDTTIIFPARNDDFLVGAASRSYYAELLEAGVKIYEFAPGLLHTKSLTLDGEITLIGSANMDRRSFDLNYENNILLADAGVTGQMQARQQDYLNQSRRVTAQEVADWTAGRRLAHNALAIMGPLL